MEDPFLYRDRVAAVFNGQIPYIETEIEHLPGSLIYMAAVWLIGGYSSEATYLLLFAASTGAILWLTARFVSGISESLGNGRAFWRFTFVCSPLLPLVIYRNDPLSVLAAVLSLAALSRGFEGRAGWWAALGIFAKGWPLVLAAAGIWQRRWRWFATLAGFALLLIGSLALTSGFRAAREFSGLHIETLMGSLVGLVRSFRPEGVSMAFHAGAVYIEVPTAVIWVQVAVGCTTLGAIVWGSRSQAYDIHRLILCIAGLVLLVLLAGPLFSAQFLLWVLPLLVMIGNRRLETLGALSGVLTLAYLLGWEWQVARPGVWLLVVATRNLLLCVALVCVIRGLRRPTEAAGLEA